MESGRFVPQEGAVERGQLRRSINRFISDLIGWSVEGRMNNGRGIK
jgi:hypothetical protein